jgi:ribose 5-phosphate isomerase B
MRIALGSDHRGADAVTMLAETLRGLGHEPTVHGAGGGAACDYPDQAYGVATAVRDGEADLGILICGSGIGMSMAANKVPGIRAALACDEAAAAASRQHNDANVLCLSGDRLSDEEVRRFTAAFLGAAFEGGRHARRVAKIDAIERGDDPADVHEGQTQA